MLLCMASSPPLAENNEKSSYYVQKQLFLEFYLIIIFLSIINIKNSKRFAIIGFLFYFFNILPILGTDFVKAARWLSIMSFSLQPSEFLSLSL